MLDDISMGVLCSRIAMRVSRGDVTQAILREILMADPGRRVDDPGKVSTLNMCTNITMCWEQFTNYLDWFLRQPLGVVGLTTFFCSVIPDYTLLRFRMPTERQRPTRALGTEMHQDLTLWITRSSPEGQKIPPKLAPIFMPVELMLLAVNSNLFVFLFYPDDMMGRLFAFSVFTILEPSLSSQQWGLGPRYDGLNKISVNRNITRFCE